MIVIWDVVLQKCNLNFVHIYSINSNCSKYLVYLLCTANYLSKQYVHCLVHSQIEEK